MRTSRPPVGIGIRISKTQGTDRPGNSTGLDAFTAQNVMQTLRDLASDGRTIVVSIHQPRSDIWQMFDNALLLVKGGRTAYSGPANAILPFFAKVGKECPPHFKCVLSAVHVRRNRTNRVFDLARPILSSTLFPSITIRSRRKRHRKPGSIISSQLGETRKATGTKTRPRPLQGPLPARISLPSYGKHRSLALSQSFSRGASGAFISSSYWRISREDWNLIAPWLPEIFVDSPMFSSHDCLIRL